MELKKNPEFLWMGTGVGALKNLKILSLGRNLIKGFAGLEALGDTLEELWISYNLIEKMKGINAMRNLRVLYMSNNLVREWSEFNKLQELGNLQDLLFVGNPLHESLEVGPFSVFSISKNSKNSFPQFAILFSNSSTKSRSN